MATTNPPTPRPAPPVAARPAGAGNAPPRANGAPPKASPPARSRIGSIKRGRLRVPLRHLFYGPEGVGKSSLAADTPGVLLMDIEGGSPELDVARYQFRDDENGHVPLNYEEVLAGLDDLIANPGHGYLSLAIDTIDALETMIHSFICQRDNRKGIEGYGYGKGYRVALEEMRRFLAKLDELRKQGVQIFLLGHSTVSQFKNPEGKDYDRYQLRLHALAAGQVKEWCDVVGFVHFEEGGADLVGDESPNKRARGWYTKRRLAEFARTAAWDAKSRLSLPETIVLDQARPWGPFADAKQLARESTPESLHTAALLEIDRITGGDHDAAFTSPTGVVTSGRAVIDMLNTTDHDVLTRVVAGLRSTAAINPSQES